MESPEQDIQSSTLPTTDAPGATKEAGTTKKKAKKKEQGSDIANIISFPFIVIAAVTIVLSLIGFLPIGFIGEFCASLRAQYVLILLVCLLPALFAPAVRVPMVIACALFALFNFLCVLPCLMPKAEPTGDLKNLKFLKFRVMQLNIDDPKIELQPIVDEVLKQHPEVVCVTGITTPVVVKLNEKMPPLYMHRASFARDDGFGTAIYSTVALKGTRLRKVGPAKLPVAITSIHFDFGWFRLVVVRLPDPKDGASLDKRNEQLKATAKMIKELNGKKIVVGNFNMSPYSMAFGDFLKESDLVDSRIGSGVQPNWHLWDADIGFLRIPVDHMFISNNVATLSRYVLQPMGMSHRPILGEFYPATGEQIPYTEEKMDAGAEAPPKAAAPKPEEKKEPKPGRKKRRGR